MSQQQEDVCSAVYVGKVVVVCIQVNIRQLQGMLDTYFTINPYIWQHLASNIPPLRDVNEVRQASTNYVSREAPQSLLVTSTFPDTSHSQLEWL